MTSRTRHIRYKGALVTFRELSDAHGIPPETLRQRHDKGKRDAELVKPVRELRMRPFHHRYHGLL